MTYELAKELKDAGFPQSKVQGAWWYDARQNPFIHPHEYGAMQEEWVPHCVRIPTLSELIEAVGEKFQGITREASSFNAIGKQFLYDDPQSDRMLCGGPTPEESVAKLWLALNKK